MSRKWEILKKITDSGLVVVVRADNADTARSPTHASCGAAAIEITYTVPEPKVMRTGQEYAGKIIIEQAPCLTLKQQE